MIATLRRRPPEQRLLMDDVPWQSYEQVLRAFEGRRIRITYDFGRLEIMTLSSRHERTKHLLGLLIVTLAMHLGKEIAGYGSLTMKRREKMRGLEPDECFWIQNEARMRNKPKYDLRKDPPPDLALEIDVTSSSVDRMSIYAALKVPEVWRWKKETLEAHLLNEEGKYEHAKFSKAFHGFQPARLVDFLEVAAKDGEVTMLRVFRVWIRKNLKKN